MFWWILFLNCERTCGLTDVPASIYDRKTAARPFDTNHNIIRCLSLAQFLLKGRNAPIWRIGNPGVKGLKEVCWLLFQTNTVLQFVLPTWLLLDHCGMLAGGAANFTQPFFAATFATTLISTLEYFVFKRDLITKKNVTQTVKWFWTDIPDCEIELDFSVEPLIIVH